MPLGQMSVFSRTKKRARRAGDFPMGDLGAVIFQNQAEGHRWSVNARKGNSMSPMPLHTLVCALVVAVWSSAGNAATFELARWADGIITQGVKVEGDIVPGDAKKLLDFYMTYGVTTSPVHLRSKGGNVEEAMKMGAIIRRLRLETEVPVWDTGRQPIDAVKVDHQENTICASACFLVYAGGASRFGNYVAMHRPFFPREEARKLSDVEYEAAQKNGAEGQGLSGGHGYRPLLDRQDVFGKLPRALHGDVE